MYTKLTFYEFFSKYLYYVLCARESCSYNVIIKRVFGPLVI